MKLRNIRQVLVFTLALSAIAAVGASLASCASSSRESRGLGADAYNASAPSPQPQRWSPVGIASDSLGNAVASTGSTPLLGDIPLSGGYFDGRVVKPVDRRAFADSSCLPPLNEEVWVIERPHHKAAQVN
jgi:hypothetical protein